VPMVGLFTLSSWVLRRRERSLCCSPFLIPVASCSGKRSASTTGCHSRVVGTRRFTGLSITTLLCLSVCNQTGYSQTMLNAYWTHAEPRIDGQMVEHLAGSSRRSPRTSFRCARVEDGRIKKRSFASRTTRRLCTRSGSSPRAGWRDSAWTPVKPPATRSTATNRQK